MFYFSVAFFATDFFSVFFAENILLYGRDLTLLKGFMI